MNDAGNFPSDKKRAAPEKDAAPKYNEYYAGVSRKFRAAKYISILLTIVFLLTAIATNRSELTIENLQYLMKFISFTNTETSITATRINYPTSDKKRLSLYLGDLCYLSGNGYALYDSRGNTIMTETVKYNFPMLVTGAKFALCYDLGGTTFSIFNTFALLSSGTLDYPITAGDISDAGDFIIATSTREYRTAVQLYDSDLKLTGRILREGYLSDAKIKKDGSEIAVMTSMSRDGEFQTDIELILSGHDSVRRSVSFAGLGYSLNYMDGGISVVYDGGILFYDSELQLVGSVKSSSLAMTDCSDKYLACAFTSGIIGNSYSVVVYDKTGRVAAETELSGKLHGIDHDASGEYIFFLAGPEVTRLNLVNRKVGRVKVDSGGTDIVAMSEDSFLLAMSSYALTCTPESFNESYFDASGAETDNQPPESSDAAETVPVETTSTVTDESTSNGIDTTGTTSAGDDTTDAASVGGNATAAP